MGPYWKSFFKLRNLTWFRPSTTITLVKHIFHSFDIVKPSKTFKLPYITVEKTKEIIQKLKPSTLSGHDKASIKIFKKLKDKIALYIIHLKIAS